MTILFDSNVLAAMEVLPHDLQARIHNALARLQVKPGGTIAGPHVQLLQGSVNSWAVRVDPDFRLLVRREGEAIRVVNLARKSYS
jgi:hypothetical protein